MKFTAQKLYEIAEEEYAQSGLSCENNNIDLWAVRSSQKEFRDEEEVRQELRSYIRQELEGSDF